MLQTEDGSQVLQQVEGEAEEAQPAIDMEQGQTFGTETYQQYQVGVNLTSCLTQEDESLTYENQKENAPENKLVYGYKLQFAKVDMVITHNRHYSQTGCDLC